MSGPADRADELERLVARALREEPPTAAPASLESRVLAALERRAVRPWWQRGFAAWPLALRALFTAGAAGSVAVLLWALERVPPESMPGQALSRVDSLFAFPRGAGQAFISAGELAVRLLEAIPRGWLYAGLLAAAALYAVLFGLLAVAYLALYAAPARTQGGTP